MTRPLRLLALLGVLVLALAAALAARWPPRPGRRSTTSRTRSCATSAASRSTSPSPRAPTSSARSIKRLIAQGLTKKQIKDRLVAQYGPSILATPRTTASRSPPTSSRSPRSLAALVALAIALPRWRRRRAAPRGERRRRRARAQRRRRAAPRRGPRALRRLTHPGTADRRCSPPPPRPTRRSSPPSRSASCRSSRRACCRSCPATCRPSRASAIADMRTGEHKLSAILVAGRDLLPVVHDHVRRARHDRDRRSARRCATPADARPRRRHRDRRDGRLLPARRRSCRGSTASGAPTR